MNNCETNCMLLYLYTFMGKRIISSSPVVVAVVVVVEVVVEVKIVVLEGRFPHFVLHGQHLPVRMLTHLFFLGWNLHSLQQKE